VGNTGVVSNHSGQNVARPLSQRNAQHWENSCALDRQIVATTCSSRKICVEKNKIPAAAAAAAAASSLCKYIFYIFCLQKKEIDFFLLLNCSELIETPKL
jgi:hypothetical protein